ncbi:sulfotransferase [Ideonella sp. B7]|uniref:sulfotransferase n=1 Tax=Ideonella benzenivorans TaxID=2831643 RepID=UPI001CEC945B|nr:sulfotransferase [Ideonella benzenivorans]MCA6215290.1 sulfotransferase [Ideonella benzenivorans]
MSDVVVHIGLNKTGTSSIQDFLALNTDALRAEGICYPRAGRTGAAHHALSAWVGSAEADADPSASPVAQALLAEIQGMPRVWLSSEDFHARGPRGARNLARLLQGHPVRIVLYLREHLAYLASWYQQNVQASGLSCSFETFCHLTHKPLSEVAETWGQVFGHGQLTLRLYDRRSLVGGDVLKDFAAQVGLEGDLGRFVRKPYENNPSISGNLLFIKRLLNNLLPPAEAASMVDELMVLSKLKPSFQGSMRVGPELAAQVAGAYAGDRRRLSHRWGLEWPVPPTELSGAPVPDLATLHADWHRVQKAARQRGFALAAAMDWLQLGDLRALDGASSPAPSAPARAPSAPVNAQPGTSGPQGAAAVYVDPAMVELIRGHLDPVFYAAQLSPQERGEDPVLHYLTRGAAQGLDPSPDFGTRAYLAWHADVREAGLNPFFHYLAHGRLEGRQVWPAGTAAEPPGAELPVAAAPAPAQWTAASLAVLPTETRLAAHVQAMAACAQAPALRASDPVQAALADWRAPEARWLALLGMHRSGTSLLAGMLQALGVWLGPAEDLLGPQPDNPEGFFEHPALMGLDEAVLDRADSAWDDPAPDLARVQALATDPVLQAQARLWLRGLWRSRPEGAVLTAFKDPRLCYTAGFWQAQVPELQGLVVLRHPLAVARSLRARGGYSSLRHGLALWAAHHRALAPWRGRAEVPVLLHSDLLAAPRATLAPVLAALGLQASEGQWAQALAQVRPGRVHQNLAGDVQAALPADVAALWADWQAAAWRPAV